MDKSDIAQIIKDGLKRNKMKQIELANRLGVKKGVINTWVTGRATPPGEKLIALINILGLKNEFFGGSSGKAHKNKRDSMQKEFDELKRDVQKKIACIEEAVSEIKGILFCHRI